MISANFHAPQVAKTKKFQLFKKSVRWSEIEAIGFLGLFYGHALELNQTGEISDWDKDYLADLIPIGDTRSELIWESLVTFNFIETRGSRMFICDWVDICGPALKEKYKHHDRQRLINIWELHGQTYGPDVPQKPPGNVTGSEIPNNSLPVIEKLESGSGETKTRPPPSTQSPEKSYSSTKDHDKSPSSFPFWETKEKEEGEPVKKSGSPQNDVTSLAVGKLQRRYYEELAGCLGEKPTTFDWGSAGTVFKKLLRQNWGMEEIAGRFVPWFQSTDSFLRDRGFRVTDFQAYFNRLKNGPIGSNKGNSHGQIESVYDGAATVR